MQHTPTTRGFLCRFSVWVPTPPTPHQSTASQSCHCLPDFIFLFFYLFTNIAYSRDIPWCICPSTLFSPFCFPCLFLFIVISALHREYSICKGRHLVTVQYVWMYPCSWAYRLCVCVCVVLRVVCVFFFTCFSLYSLSTRSSISPPVTLPLPSFISNKGFSLTSAMKKNYSKS